MAFLKCSRSCLLKRVISIKLGITSTEAFQVLKDVPTSLGVNTTLGTEALREMGAAAQVSGVQTKSLAQELMNQGKEKKAQKILDFVEKNAPNSEGKNDGGEMEEEWGSKKREYKRMGGKKMGDVDGHYKDYEVNESIIRRRTKRK
jgi:hypothetical protein